MVKKLIAQILTISMILSMLCVGVYAEETLGLSAGGKRGLPSNAVVTTPAENSFTFGGQKFVFLGGYIGTSGVNNGYRAKDGKNYYLVLADQFYGKVAFDTDNKHIFDVNDSTTLAYWLNNDFISESYEGTKLPAAMIENLDTYEWHTEKSNVVTGYTSEYTTQCKIAVMSQYEIEKYSSMYGYNLDDSNWWTRTSYGDTESGHLYVRPSEVRVRDTVATSEMSVRPIFWLSEDFFLKNKITSPGSYVTKTLQKTLTREKFIDAAGYSEAELDAWFTPPTAVINGIEGNPVEDYDITIDYTYTSAAGFEENGTLIEWYVDDSSDGDFTEKIHTETVTGEPDGTYTLKGTDGGKYIKVKVTPRSFVAKGAMVESEVFGPIYAQAYIDEIVGIVDGLDADSVMEELGKHNAVFKLDLEMTGLTDGEKEAAVAIFADSEITDFVSLCKNYEDAMAIAQLSNAADDTETGELLSVILSEEELAKLELLDDKSEVLGAMRQGFTSSQAVKDAFAEVCTFAAVNQAKRTDKYELILENSSCFTTDFTAVEPYILKAAVASVGQYGSFAELEEALLSEVASIKKALTEEEMLGLTKSGRNTDTSPVPNSVADTPAAYRFEFGGKKFAFLDEKVKDGKSYYLIYADDSYATLPFHNVATDYNNVWSVTDETKLGYWLITDFLSSEYEGTKLPEEILDNIDYKNIWHTEPTAVTDYTTEASMLSVGGISLISNYEFKKYAGRFGTSINGTPTNAWLRTARADNSTITPLVTGKAVPGETTAPYPTSAYAIRPIFWLSEDFFREYKLTSPGSFIAKTLDSKLTYQDLLSIGYSNDEITSWFKAPTVAIDSVNGDAISGDTLSVDYTYSSDTGFEEDGTVISWYRSFNNITFTKICDAEEYTITEEDAGSYIKVSVTPKSTANINSRGKETYAITVLGPVYGSERISEVISEINLADAEDVLSTIETHNAVLNVDLSFDGLNESQKTMALDIFAASQIGELSELRKEFVQAKMIAQINQAAGSTDVLSLLTNEKTALNVEQFGTLKDNSFVVSSMSDKDFETVEAFEKAFYEAVAIQKVNEADRATIASVLRANESLFTTDLSDVSEYNLGLTGAGILGTYTEFSVLDTAVTTAFGTVKSEIDEVKKPINGGPGGSGGPGTGKKEAVNISAVGAGTASAEPAVLIYNDIPYTHWAYSSVEELSKAEILSGDGDGNFRPDDTIKREEFVKLVILALTGKGESAAISFGDVAPDSWYADYIYSAVEKGIVNGVSADNFGVGLEISRQDMAVMIYRALGDGLKTDIEADFADMNTVSEYAYEAVNALNAAGILSGDGTNVNPHQSATRAMAAKMICSAISYMKEAAK